MRNMRFVVCAVCGKSFFTRGGAAVCSEACRKERKRLYNKQHYFKGVGGTVARMTPGEVERMMMRHRLKKRDDALEASGYKVEAKRGVVLDESGRKWKSESRGRIPGGGMV